MTRELALLATRPVRANAAWASEVTTKRRIGKQPSAGPLALDFAREVRRQGFIAIAITVEHPQVAGALFGKRSEPFDGMLIAQAREENMALVSNDAVVDAFGITCIW